MGNFPLQIFLFALFLFLLLILVKLFNKPKYPYYKNPNFISFAEQAFFNVLKIAIEDKYYIFAQVSLNSLLKVDLEGKEYWQYFNKIKQKSVDFVLVDKTNFNPVLVIELDDRSHLLTYRQERDEFLEKSLTNAGIEYLRVRNRSTYNIPELKEVISNLIA
jgi:very-short-patch-repair endonuclease